MPEIEQNEVSGDVTHNEGLRIIDLHGQPVIQGQQLAEPGSPGSGDAWMINGVPTGTDWGANGSVNQIAHYYEGIWYYYTPNKGWAFYDVSTAEPYTIIQWNGLSWAAR